MTAIDFLPNKIEVKPFAPKKEYKESHRLAYYLVAILSLDLADNFKVLAEKNIIPNMDIEFFDRKAEDEYKFIESLAKEKQKQETYYTDFQIISEYFDGIVKKSLPLSNPTLNLILRSIYQIQLITHAAWHVASSEGKIMNPTMGEILERKTRHLKSAFLKRYQDVSNNLDFNFGMYENTFKTLARSTYDDFNNKISNNEKTI